MATKKKTAAKKKAPAKKPTRKPAAKKAPAKKAPAKKAARKAVKRRSVNPPQKLTLFDDRFEPEEVVVRLGETVHLSSERDDRNVPVHVPECFGLAGVRTLKKRGSTLKLKVIASARLGPHHIKAPRKTGPNTDLKGSIEVVSGD